MGVPTAIVVRLRNRAGRVRPLSGNYWLEAS